MSKYKIFRFTGQELMTIEADHIAVQTNGQTFFYKEPANCPVAVMPDGVLIVEVESFSKRPREFDFVNQKEKLDKRNEHLGKTILPVMTEDVATRILKAAKETLVPTGNGKLDENAEERVVNETEDAKLEEKRRKNREYLPGTGDETISVSADSINLQNEVWDWGGKSE